MPYFRKWDKKELNKFRGKSLHFWFRKAAQLLYHVKFMLQVTTLIRGSIWWTYPESVTHLNRDQKHVVNFIWGACRWRSNTKCSLLNEMYFQFQIHRFFRNIIFARVNHLSQNNFSHRLFIWHNKGQVLCAAPCFYERRLSPPVLWEPGVSIQNENKVIRKSFSNHESVHF